MVTKRIRWIKRLSALTVVAVGLLAVFVGYPAYAMSRLERAFASPNACGLPTSPEALRSLLDQIDQPRHARLVAHLRTYRAPPAPRGYPYELQISPLAPKLIANSGDDAEDKERQWYTAKAVQVQHLLRWHETLVPLIDDQTRAPARLSERLATYRSDRLGNHLVPALRTMLVDRWLVVLGYQDGLRAAITLLEHPEPCAGQIDLLVHLQQKRNVEQAALLAVLTQLPGWTPREAQTLERWLAQPPLASRAALAQTTTAVRLFELYPIYQELRERYWYTLRSFANVQSMCDSRSVWREMYDLWTLANDLSVAITQHVTLERQFLEPPTRLKPLAIDAMVPMGCNGNLPDLLPDYHRLMEQTYEPSITRLALRLVFAYDRDGTLPVDAEGVRQRFGDDALLTTIDGPDMDYERLGPDHFRVNFNPRWATSWLFPRGFPASAPREAADEPLRQAHGSCEVRIGACRERLSQRIAAMREAMICAVP